MAKETIKLIVKGGKASGGPPIGPALGPMGIPTNKVVDEINQRTADMKGMDVPVKVIVDPDTKTFEIEIGTPPTAGLLKKEIGIEKFSITEEEKKEGKIITADIPFDAIIKVAKIKKESSLARSFKAVVKEVVGACVPMNALIEGKKPKEIEAEIAEGKWDEKIKE